MFCSCKGTFGRAKCKKIDLPHAVCAANVTPLKSSFTNGSIFMIINFEQVHNYFERLVFEDVARLSVDYPDYTADMLADVACVALNRLPPRYVRHDVDMMFYLTEKERHNLEDAIHEALDFSFNFVGQRMAKRIRTA